MTSKEAKRNAAMPQCMTMLTYHKSSISSTVKIILGFWEESTDTIIDVRLTNLDSKSYKNLPPKKALERQEKEKKKKYCKLCENQRRHFTPFVVSTDGIYLLLCLLSIT